MINIIKVIDESRRLNYNRKELKLADRMWLITFNYLYMLYKEGIHFINDDKFWVGMRYQDFKKVWKDYWKVVKELYEKLVEYEDMRVN